MFLRLSLPGSPVLLLKTFGVSLKEVLVNELTRRQHLELLAAMQVEEENSQVSGHRRRRRGNVAQRVFRSLQNFFSHRRWARTALPQDFTRRGRRVSLAFQFYFGEWVMVVARDHSGHSGGEGPNGVLGVEARLSGVCNLGTLPAVISLRSPLFFKGSWLFLKMGQKSQD